MKFPIFVLGFFLFASISSPAQTATIKAATVNNLLRLVKVQDSIPALKGEEGERALGIDTAYKVLPCNNMEDFDFKKLDLSYYYNEARKLLVGVDNLEELSNHDEDDVEGGDDE